jgi:hypothetical protein
MQHSSVAHMRFRRRFRRARSSRLTAHSRLIHRRSERSDRREAVLQVSPQQHREADRRECQGRRRKQLQWMVDALLLTVELLAASDHRLSVEWIASGPLRSLPPVACEDVTAHCHAAAACCRATRSSARTLLRREALEEEALTGRRAGRKQRTNDGSLALTRKLRRRGSADDSRGLQDSRDPPIEASLPRHLWSVRGSDLASIL